MIDYSKEHCEGCVYFDHCDECMNQTLKATIERDSEALHTEASCQACEQFEPDVDTRLVIATENQNVHLASIAKSLERLAGCTNRVDGFVSEFTVRKR